MEQYDQMSLLESINEPYRITKPIRLIECFAGIGAQHKALSILGADFESWRVCEWSVNSILAYNAIHIKDWSDYSQGLTVEDLIEKFNLPKGTRIRLPDHFNDGQDGAMPTFEQVMWYYNTSKQAEKAEGRKIPAVMFMHIPLPEFSLIARNPEECGAIGSKRETLGTTEMNFGLFAACLQRGDVKGIFFGHEHLCDLQGEYCGITMAQDAALGYNMSCHDDLRGGRVIDLFEEGTIQTHTVKLIDLMGREAMRRPDYFEGGCKYYIRKL